ncbi:glucose 1-dehydrogenase [Aestuariicella hydrocarbonica]|uniref:Glucose 1-dehydrogenase n=1 Tax=Pseudomaricurvus hydrocarbonicus TaxID=1470433 RepID=A0A9E5MKJ7_9GAMM|nr:glucose 1-dehydrogenase [Aestuariicella hydrocarbonica]NHO65467.1 glucose 1-dehydrogenase [Aestuariicella hydrocarbonica]
MKNYQDQVILITGASGGLGQEAAKQFGKLGAKLALSDINAEKLALLANELREHDIDVLTMVCDVRDEDQVKAFVAATVERFGHLHAAINNAGIDPEHALLADTSLEEYQRTMDINVQGVFLCMKYQIQQMLTQGGGAICNIASVAGVGGAPFMSAYAASKHAVIGLTKSAAFEYGKFNIRVNAVCPFITMTDMFEQTLAQFPDREAALKHFGKTAALKRVAQPEEVVQAMLFACDPNNSYMTGHELVIDGGMTAV